MGLKAMAQAALQQCAPRTIDRTLAETSPAHSPVENETVRTLSDEANVFWSTFLERVDHCDQLIDQLCNLRGDSAAERTVLLKTRRNTSPENLDGDIKYLLATIAALTPPPPVPATGRCVDCESFRRAGVGERCGHAARCTPGEPPVTDCLPAHACQLFVHWRNP